MKVMRDLVGRSLSNRYRLIARLAGGGMGEVYRGHDLLLDRPVAVKVMHPSLAADPALVERFKAEARAAARLSHPNVVAVHDWGAESDDTYYMVMEYVSGSDLRDVLSTNISLDAPAALGVVAAVCDALQAAHSGGLVHRDVKPENILIARDGTVKVADFGIAAIADVDRTTGGVILGTLRYLSPEQAGGSEATARSDIWAAGAVLYELLTGEAPPNGTGTESLARRATEPPPAPSKANPGVPAAVDEIVLKACAVDAGVRYGSAAEMAAALRSVATGVTPRPAELGALLRDLTGEVALPDMAPTNFSPHGRTRRKARFRARRRAAVLAAAVALLGAILLPRAIGALTGPQKVDVPALVGLPKAGAASTAEEAGLRLEVTGRYPSRTVPKGEVLTQTPEGGRLLEDAAVRITLSSGPPKMNVPAIVGMEERIAQVRLRAAGMKVGDVTTEFSLEPEGTIVEQSPAKGKLRWGSAVDYVLSRGPRSLEIPSVYGMAVGKAAAALERAGFTVALVDSYSNQVPAGKVVSTRPAAGATAPEGSEIKVYRSIGPQYEELEMPDVRNMGVDAAKALLKKKGLVPNVVQSCGGNGSTVVETDPVAGMTVRENDSVALFVC